MSLQIIDLTVEEYEMGNAVWRGILHENNLLLP